MRIALAGTRGIPASYRQARYYAYWLLEPFDAIFRMINRLDKYPPIPLRRHVGCFGSFDGPGFEFVEYLKLLLGLKSEHRVWDIACGCGLLELALESAGWRGQLVGVDIHKPCITWARRSISKRIPSFQFVHANIYNEDYWPYGHLSTKEWFSIFGASDFDIAILKSLFTHMLPEELSVYLQQISARLSPGGKAILTFFILNEEQERLEQKNSIRFIAPSPDSVYAVKQLLVPTAAVAYTEAYLVEELVLQRKVATGQAE